MPLRVERFYSHDLGCTSDFENEVVIYQSLLRWKSNTLGYNKRIHPWKKMKVGKTLEFQNECRMNMATAAIRWSGLMKKREAVLESHGDKARQLTTQQLRVELERTEYRGGHGKTLGVVVGSLILVAAVVLLVATLWLPVLQVSGASMEPTLEDGQIVVAAKGVPFKAGDVVSFYYDNKVLLKRVIGVTGDQINLGSDGTVYVNGVVLDEPYVSEKSIGQCDIDLPYQVPDGKIFVMGDHRATSMDSRLHAIGCISDDMVVGKVIWKIWPFTIFGGIQ